MQVQNRLETSYALVSAGGRVVTTFGDDLEQRARDEAVKRSLALYRLTTVAEEVPIN